MIFAISTGRCSAITSPGQSCLQCVATKRKYTVTKEGSKKNRRVLTKKMEGTGTQKKNKKGNGKGKEGVRIQKWDKENYEDDEVEEQRGGVGGELEEFCYSLDDNNECSIGQVGGGEQGVEEGN